MFLEDKQEEVSKLNTNSIKENVLFFLFIQGNSFLNALGKD
jgi:hypothetical protein